MIFKICVTLIMFACIVPGLYAIWHKPQVYIVYWEDVKTGHRGGVGFPTTKKEAKDCIKRGNKLYPHIKHWMEKTDLEDMGVRYNREKSAYVFKNGELVEIPENFLPLNYVPPQYIP